MKITNNLLNLLASALLAMSLVGCSSDVENPPTIDGSTTPNSGNTDAGTGAANNGTYSIGLSNDTVNLVEGSDVTLAVQVQRSVGYDRQITLAIEGQTPGQINELDWTFSNTRLAANQNSATVTIRMDYSALPIQRQTRTLRVLATDGGIQSVAVLNINVIPTSLPDVYLLAGQSNMVGLSEQGGKQAFVGGADAPINRIQQLNVTGNDQENFKTVSSFTSVNSIAVPSPRLTTAVDPLHDGYDSLANGKGGTRIGLGISFAKRAIANTEASIYLVPAAWSDSGFCQRERAEFAGVLGWNASPQTNPAFSGTLLHDRAIARANLTLGETGGILRGILWHQGEADSDDPACAQQYEQNLRDMVNSMRTKIQQDARGPSARGPNANIPFVVGTMSRGGEYDILSETKLIVDGAHRNIGQIVPFSAFVNNDDLIPPDYPCGAGDCIHFGSTALREMGSRYYDALIQATTGQ